MYEALSFFRSSLRATPHAVLAIGLATWVTVSSAADIRVPADQPTIQDGINAAVDGDRVMVSPGTYFEHISVNKSISIIGADGAASTAIDGSNDGAVAVFYGGEPLLQGFTIIMGMTMVNLTAEAVSPSARPHVLRLRTMLSSTTLPPRALQFMSHGKARPIFTGTRFATMLPVMEQRLISTETPVVPALPSTTICLNSTGADSAPAAPSLPRRVGASTSNETKSAAMYRATGAQRSRSPRARPSSPTI